MDGSSDYRDFSVLKYVVSVSNYAVQRLLLRSLWSSMIFTINLQYVVFPQIQYGAYILTVSNCK